MTFIDCHLHISDKFFFKRVDYLLLDWSEFDVEKIGAVATNLRESQRNIEIATKYPSIVLAGIGRHPWGAHKFTEQELMIFKGLAQNPQVTFIGEVDDVPQNIKPNFWYMDRNYYLGFYVLGYLAALKTETGRIGYVGGLNLPFAKGEVNAAKQAIRDSGSDVELHYIFVFFNIFVA